MRVVFARMFVRPEGVDQVVAALPALTLGSRAEVGNHMFIAHQHPEDPTTFGFYEQFTDAAAHELHSKSAHVREILDLQAKYGTREIEVTVWNLKEPA